MWYWIFLESHLWIPTHLNGNFAQKKVVIPKMIHARLELKLIIYLKKSWCSYTHSCIWYKTYWMYLRETFWLCLVVMVRMYICRAANRSAASYFNSGPNRSSTTSLQLYKAEGRGQTSWRSRSLFRGFIFPVSKSHSRGSPLRRGKVFATSVAWDSSKGVPFPDPRCTSPRLKMVKSDVKSWLAFFSLGLMIKDILWGSNLLLFKIKVYTRVGWVEDFICVFLRCERIQSLRNWKCNGSCSQLPQLVAIMTSSRRYVTIMSYNYV